MKHRVMATLLALVFPLAGALAAGAGDTVDIDGVWGVSEQGTVGEGAINLPTDGSSFLLGEFTHYNTTTNGDLADYNPLENVGLTIRFSGSADAAFEYTVTLVETVNDEVPCKFPEAPNVPGCGEKVSIGAQPLQSSVVEIEGESYTMEVLGFTNCSDAATPNNVLYTREMAIDVACLYARLVAIK